MKRKIITILIVGLVVLTATITFAGKDYNSSISNSSSLSIINEQVGNILLRYGVGGAEINEVTDALAVGIDEVDLKSMLIKFDVSDAGITEVFAELDRLGAGDAPQSAPATGTIRIKDPNGGTAVSSPDTGDTPQAAPEGTIKIHTQEREVSAPAAGVEKETAKEAAEESAEEPAGDTSRSAAVNSGLELVKEEMIEFRDASKNIIQNIRAAAPEERENLKEELKVSRGTFQTEIVSMNLSIRENAKELRDNFRENVRTVIGHVDHGKTARIAIAHGKGLRMLNRFRSAMARFDHILGRLESRVNKLEAQGYPTDSFFDVWTSIEEAKNMSVENEAKMEELKAKYESLLLGENAGGIAEEARAIAKELKAETENLHAKLRAITDGIKKSIPTIGAAQTILDIPDDFAAPYTPGTDTFGRSDTDLTQRIAQSFMFSTGQTINQIKIVAQDVNFPTDGINVSIQTDSGSDSPSGSELASASKSRQELLSAGVDNSKFTQITFNLGSNYPSLAANTQYWVVVARENEDPFDNGNYYQLRNYADIYPDGKQRNLVRCDIGYVWIVAGFACNQIITVGGGGGGGIVIGGGTGLVADPPVMVVSPGAGLPGGGYGGTQVSFDIDLELWKTMRPIKDRVPIR